MNRWTIRILYVVLFQAWWIALLTFQGAWLAFPIDVSVLGIYFALCILCTPLLTVLATAGRGKT